MPYRIPAPKPESPPRPVRPSLLRPLRRSMWLAFLGFAASPIFLLARAGLEASVLEQRCGLSFAYGAERDLYAVESLLHIITFIAFLVWVHRATANLATLRRPIEWTPGTAVLLMLVTIVNFYFGYRILAEIARRTRIDETVRSRVFVWWVTRSAGVALTFAVTIARRNSSLDLETWKRGVVLQIAAAAFFLVALPMAVSVMRVIGHVQERELTDLPS